MDIAELDHGQEQGSPGRHWPIWGEMDHGPAASKAGLLVAVVLGILLLSPAAWACRLSVLGDSLTAGYGVAEQDAFPIRLQAALKAQGAECEVLNAGVSGDTSAGGLARLEWVLADQPTHLLVELGGNDALRGLPVEQLKENLNRIVSTAKDRGVEVILAGMLAPPNMGRSYADAFKQVYLDVAGRNGVPLYPFFLDGVVMTEGMMQPDGIHPNGQGVEVIAERIAPLVAATMQDN